MSSWADEYDFGRKGDLQGALAQMDRDIRFQQLEFQKLQEQRLQDQFEFDKSQRPALTKLQQTQLNTAQLAEENETLRLEILREENEQKKREWVAEFKEKEDIRFTNQWQEGEMMVLNQIKKKFEEASSTGNVERANKLQSYHKRFSRKSRLDADDYESMLLDIFSDEELQMYFDVSGVGETMLADYDQDGFRRSERKRLINFRRSPDNQTFTAQVMTNSGSGREARVGPITEGGEEFASGANAIPELEMGALGRVMMLMDNQFSDPRQEYLANYAQDDPLIQRRIQDAGGTLGDLLTMSRTDKESILTDPNAMQNMGFDEIVSKQLYEGLGGPTPGQIPEMDAEQGIKVDGVALTGEEPVRDYVDNLFDPSLIKREDELVVKGQTMFTYSPLAAESILDQYPEWNEHVHVENRPFGLSPEQQGWLDDGTRTRVNRESKTIALAAANKKIRERVRKGDIGKTITQLNMGKGVSKYVENKPIDGKQYTREQALKIKEFWSGTKNNTLIAEKLSTSPLYMTEFEELGAADFALKHGAEDSDFFKIVQASTDKKVGTEAAVDLAQIKNYLNTEHGIVMPTIQPDGSIDRADLVEFRTSLQESDLPVDKLNDIDSTVAKWMSLSIDNTEKTINSTWMNSPANKLSLASLTYALLGDNKIPGDLDQLLDFAVHGTSSSILGDDIQASNLEQSKLQMGIQLMQKSSGYDMTTLLKDVNTFSDKALGILSTKRPTVDGSTLFYESDKQNAAAGALQSITLRGTQILTNNNGNVNSREYQQYLNAIDAVQGAFTKSYFQGKKDNKWLEFLYGGDTAGGYTTSGTKGAYLTINGRKLVSAQQLMTGNQLDPQKLRKIGTIGIVDPAGNALGAEGTFYDYHRVAGDAIAISFITDAIAALQKKR